MAFFRCLSHVWTWLVSSIVYKRHFTSATSTIFRFLCVCHPTVSERTLCFRAVSPPRLFVRPVRYCYHDISWTAWAILMKRTVSIYRPLLMTWLDSEGQRSRSWQAIKVTKASTSTLIKTHLLVWSFSGSTGIRATILVSGERWWMKQRWGHVRPLVRVSALLFPSVFWQWWLGGRKNMRPVKTLFKFCKMF